LYRGWGAELAQKSSKENSTDEEKEVISPQLLEAIRLEWIAPWRVRIAGCQSNLPTDHVLKMDRAIIARG